MLHLRTLGVLSLHFGLAFSAAFPAVIPAVHSFVASPSQGTFSLPSHLRIVVDATVANTTDSDGQTLIPPTLLSFAQTFADDVRSVFEETSTEVFTSKTGSGGDIFLSILPPGKQDNLTLADGSFSSEGYLLDIKKSSVTIQGAGARGVFWGTRTLLQGLVLNAKKLPAGTVSDQPDWATRGFMLDAGRQWYPISFMKELCTYASWFKLSEFHTHLSDNVAVRDPKTTYARFRLRPTDPELIGLTPYINETYSRDEFEDFQTHCAARGVTVIPEIESPGHALVITQWKPNLALSTDPSLLNISVSDTIPTVKSIWKEFLPWLHSKQVSIGADEYSSALADDYNDFVNEMSDFIGQESRKTIRIWGTNEPSNKTSVSKNITIQHWDFSDDDPFQLIRQGYKVINSDDAFQYIVMKSASGSFPPKLNQTRLWNGANVNTGGIWDPHIFDRGNASNNPTVDTPLLPGAIMAAWNDPGPNATTYLEAFYALKEGLPVIAAAGWQSATRPNHLTEEQYLSSFPSLEAAAPGQNLDRRVPSIGDVVLDYDLTHSTHASGGRIEDKSGNGYDGKLENGTIVTPLGSKGHNYTFLLTVHSESPSGTLLSGPDDSFGFTSFGGGKTLAFTSSNRTWPLLNYIFSPTTVSSTEIIVTSTENGTSAFVDGNHVGDFVIAIDGNPARLAPMAFVAPVERILGSVSRFTLWDGVKDISSVSRR